MNSPRKLRHKTQKTKTPIKAKCVSISWLPMKTLSQLHVTLKICNYWHTEIWCISWPSTLPATNILRASSTLVFTITFRVRICYSLNDTEMQGYFFVPCTELTCVSKHQNASESHIWFFETWEVFLSNSKIRKRHDIQRCILRFWFLELKVWKYFSSSEVFIIFA